MYSCGLWNRWFCDRNKPQQHIIFCAAAVCWVIDVFVLVINDGRDFIYVTGKMDGNVCYLCGHFAYVTVATYSWLITFLHLVHTSAE